MWFCLLSFYFFSLTWGVSDMFICSSVLLIPLITSPLNHCYLSSEWRSHPMCNAHGLRHHLWFLGKRSENRLHSVTLFFRPPLSAIYYGDAMLSHFRVRNMTQDPFRSTRFPERQCICCFLSKDSSRSLCTHSSVSFHLIRCYYKDSISEIVIISAPSFSSMT